MWEDPVKIHVIDDPRDEGTVYPKVDCAVDDRLDDRGLPDLDARNGVEFVVVLSKERAIYLQLVR